MLKVNKAISDMVKSIETSTVEKIKSFITEKIATEYDEEMLEAITKMFDEVAEEIKKNSETENMKKSGKKDSGDKKEKKKREPTEYNLFLKEKMAEIKAAGTTLKGKDLMKAAIELWREKKKSNSSEEEPKAEESDAEEPKAEESDAEEPKAEESDAEEEKPKPTGKATKGQGKKSKK